MTLYHYVAMNAEGKSLKGELDASDLNDLKRILTGMGLFLVAYSIVPKKTESASQAPVGLLDIRVPALTKRTKVLWWAGGLSAYVLAIFVYFAFFASTNPFISVRRTSSKTSPATLIHRGMQRDEVEKLEGITFSTSTVEFTRYNASPHLMIEVRYDSTGGPGSPQNKVLKDPRLFYH